MGGGGVIKCAACSRLSSSFLPGRCLPGCTFHHDQRSLMLVDVHFTAVFIMPEMGPLREINVGRVGLLGGCIGG